LKSSSFKVDLSGILSGIWFSFQKMCEKSSGLSIAECGIIVHKEAERNCYLWKQCRSDRQI
jgi:hypothetical protein